MRSLIRHNRGPLGLLALGLLLGGVVYSVPDVTYEVLGFLARVGSKNQCGTCRPFSVLPNRDLSQTFDDSGTN